jgi:hypothetical protein
MVAQSGVSADAPNAPNVIPVISPVSNNAKLLGAAAAGEPGEAWAFATVNSTTLPPTVNGQVVPFAGGDQQATFLRYTDATGWQTFETPAEADGITTLAKFVPVDSSASVTPHGGGVIIGKSGTVTNVLIRQSSGSNRRYTVNNPTSPVLQSGESTASGNLAPATAFEEGNKTSVLAAAISSSATGVDGVVYFDGTKQTDQWSRDTVELPPGASSFKIRAIDAAGSSNAWLIAKLDPSFGIALFHRDADATWRRKSLGDPQFEGSAASVPENRSQVGFDPITATENGVWLDGRVNPPSGQSDFTLYYDKSSSQTTTWCDAGPATCDRPLGASLFGTGSSYRSTAWAGSGFGTRVITNPRDPSGAAETTRGTYLSLKDGAFARVPGAGDVGDGRSTSALRSADSGWLNDTVQLTSAAPKNTISPWSVGSRAPFQAVTGAPGEATGDLGSGALAVGDSGDVARYQPGAGWITEFLQSTTGAVRRPDLRGVAWPEPGRAHAVGTNGEMWLWRKETGLWERDPGAPIGNQTQFTDVAFNPSDPTDGYAIGRAGTILQYGKSWERVPLGQDVPNTDCDPQHGQRLPPSLQDADFRKIAFSGGEPLVVSDTDLLKYHDGGWQIDCGVHELIVKYATKVPMSLLTVAGLPDGGAFIAGTNGFALQRDSLTAPWKAVKQPLPNVAVTRSALFRENGELRALISVVLQAAFPQELSRGTLDPSVPAPPLYPLVTPPEGYLLRETAGGWSDEQNSALQSTSSNALDRPLKSEPILGVLAGADGQAWVVGGWNGASDAMGRGFPNGGPRTSVKTAFIGRYSGTSGRAASSQDVQTSIPQSQGTINFAVGGQAVCENANCDQYRNVGIAPDRQLQSALAITERMSEQVGGPRFFMYTGGRIKSSSTTALSPAQANRSAELLGSQSALPAYSAVSPGDTLAGNADNYKAAFSSFRQPFGDGAPAADAAPRGGAGSGTRTHYSFDSQGNGGKLRVIVIDNSRGRLDLSDSYQNPPVGPSEPYASQEDWLRSELRSAKADGVPAIVVGNRSLNSTFRPYLDAAKDADQIAKLLRDEGASAYFFDRPEENRQLRIPANSSDTIPSFGTGALGYRGENTGVNQDTEKADSYFGNTGFLIAQVDASARNPSTNRAPVSVRMIPLVDGLNLDAIDGTLLRRSRPALFSGLGRRPLAGDRWGGGGDSPTPAGSDPYTTFPQPPCTLSACETLIAPEYQFSSSDPDIADFVAVDPLSSNTRKPYQNALGKTVADPSSGLLCPFNAGTTTLTISAGGRTYARQITVQPGSVRPPCGTVPLDPKRFTAKQPAVGAPAPPPPAPVSPVVALSPPLPFVVPPAAKPSPRPTPRAPQPEFFVPPLDPVVTVPVTPPPPAPSLARPIPPTGGMARAPEKQREEEAATEDSQAFARYQPDAPPNITLPFIGLIIIAAFAGSALPRARRGRGGQRSAPAYSYRPSEQPQWRRPR